MDEIARVRRRGEYPRLTKIPGYLFELLGSSEQLQILRVTVQPGGTTQRFSHEGEEWHFVLQGALHVEVDGKHCHLAEGDCVWHRSDKPHRWQNDGVEPAVVLCVASPRTFLSTVMTLEE